MSFLAVVIQLTLKHPAKLARPLVINAAHLPVLATFYAEQPETGSILQELQQKNTFIPGTIQIEKSSILVRMSFLGCNSVNLASRVISELSQIQSFEINQGVWAIQEISMTEKDWAGISSWADLAGTIKGDKLKFSFKTPAVFEKKAIADNKPSLIYPQAKVLFSDLLESWQSLGGPQLHPQISNYLETNNCLTSKYKLETIEYQLPNFNQKGFTGNIDYICRKSDKEYLPSLTALTRLAFFRGVGSYTSFGMGMTKVQFSE